MPPLDERFNVHRTGLIERSYHFRDQAGRVAFTDHWLSLSTAGESLAAIKAMVDRAAERGWKTVGLKGSPEFVRLSWIAANVQGLKAVGHTPTAADRETVLKERARLEAVQSADTPQNQVDAITRVQTAHLQRTVTDRSGQEFNAQRHLATAIEKALTDSKVPPEIRGQVRALMAAEGSRRLLSGERIKVPVYDAQAPRARTQTIQPDSRRVNNLERSR